MNSNSNKIVLPIFLFLFFACNIAAQPKVVIEPTSFDYGSIVQDSIVTTIFVITNEGTDILKINDVKASCGCTAVVIGTKELKPGESTDIKASFDSKGKSGIQNKTITVKTNDPVNSIIKLAFNGNVKKNMNELMKSKNGDK